MGPRPKLIRGRPTLTGGAAGVVIAIIAMLMIDRERMGTFVIVVLIFTAIVYSWWYVTRTERGRAAWAAYAERKRNRD